MKGEINIVLEGISFDETERYREIIHTLIASNALNVKSGKTILHWDNNVLQGVEIDIHLWKRGKSPPFKVTDSRVMIENMKPGALTQTTSGQPKE